MRPSSSSLLMLDEGGMLRVTSMRGSVKCSSRTFPNRSDIGMDVVISMLSSLC